MPFLEYLWLYQNLLSIYNFTSFCKEIDSTKYQLFLVIWQWIRLFEVERQTSDASNMYMHGMSVFQLRAHPLFLIKALSIKKEIVSFKVKVTETNYILVSLFSLVRVGWIPVVHFNIDSRSKHRYDKNFCNKEKSFDTDQCNGVL